MPTFEMIAEVRITRDSSSLDYAFTLAVNELEDVVDEVLEIREAP
jgi:hypothetical protein